MAPQRLANKNSVELHVYLRDRIFRHLLEIIPIRAEASIRPVMHLDSASVLGEGLLALQLH